MQTFLPYPDFVETATCLDNKRLGKQRVEAKQIYLALTEPNYGWKHHPAVKMWRGWESHLALYGRTICSEWIRRGYNDSLFDFFDKHISSFNLKDIHDIPTHFNDAFHASHRSNLLRKDPVWYGVFGWTEPTTLPYVWPVSNPQRARTQPEPSST